MELDPALLSCEVGVGLKPVTSDRRAFAATTRRTKRATAFWRTPPVSFRTGPVAPAAGPRTRFATVPIAVAAPLRGAAPIVVAAPIGVRRAAIAVSRRPGGRAATLVLTGWSGVRTSRPAIGAEPSEPAAGTKTTKGTRTGARPTLFVQLTQLAAELRDFITKVIEGPNQLPFGHRARPAERRMMTGRWSERSLRSSRGARGTTSFLLESPAGPFTRAAPAIVAAAVPRARAVVVVIVILFAKSRDCLGLSLRGRLVLLSI